MVSVLGVCGLGLGMVWGFGGQASMDVKCPRALLNSPRGEDEELLESESLLGEGGPDVLDPQVLKSSDHLS